MSPTAARAREAARSLAGYLSVSGVRPVSLRSFLAAGASLPAVLCPSGRSVGEDLAFLREVRERALWELPDSIVHAAIAGLLGSPTDAAPARGARARGGGLALLLEGSVGWTRARAALRSDARVWVVESAGQARLSRRRLEELERRGVRWAVLRPVVVVALAASPRLARARPRWKNLLPAKTPVWVIKT